MRNCVAGTGLQGFCVYNACHSDSLINMFDFSFKAINDDFRVSHC